MRCKSLVVFYEQDGEGADKSKTLQAAAPGPGGEQRIKRLEARGGVVVSQKDQTATGELGIFDMKSNTVTLTGNPVVMTQGQNVLRGGRLMVDLTSGVSRVEWARTVDACRDCFCPAVRGLISSRMAAARRPAARARAAIQLKP